MFNKQNPLKKGILNHSKLPHTSDPFELYEPAKSWIPTQSMVSDDKTENHEQTIKIPKSQMSSPAYRADCWWL